MDIEYEATFPNIDKKEIRRKLKKVGASLVRPEYLQRRIPFELPKGHKIKGGFVRVRDEGDKITLSLKIFDGDKKVEDQKELCLTVNNFNETVEFLKLLGCKLTSFQENKRELWKLDGVEITIDEWPFLEPLVEIEGRSEKAIKKVSEKIGFDYSKALFCGTTKIYQMKYKISAKKINFAPKIIFDMKNPFLKKKV